MSQTASSIKKQKYEAGAARVDLKLEVEIVPVSAIDRAKKFYQRLGWHLDLDDIAGDDLRSVPDSATRTGTKLPM